MQSYFNNCFYNRCVFYILVTTYESTVAYCRLALHVCSRDTSALCSPSRQSLSTALVRRGFISKDTSLCRLICVAVWRPYSTTN